MHCPKCQTDQVLSFIAQFILYSYIKVCPGFSNMDAILQVYSLLRVPQERQKSITIYIRYIVILF